MNRKRLENIRFFNIPGLNDVRIVHGSNVANEFRRHVHDSFCIGFVQQGVREIHRGDTSTIIPEKNVFVINPGESHACKSRYGKHSYFTVCVEAERMKKIASQISGRVYAMPHFNSIRVSDRGLCLKIRRFFALVENSNAILEREAVLVSMLSTLIIRYGNKPAILYPRGLHRDAIKRVCEFIRTNYEQELSLKQLARVACLSPFYLQRLFLKNTGISPHDYLVGVRIKKARALLEAGCSIAGVALDTGFVDQSHLTRSFKQVMGITPGAYIQNSE